MTVGRTLLRAGRMSWESFRRNLWLSFVTILILTVSLVLFSMVLGINVVASRLTASLSERIDLTVNFKPSASQSTVRDLEKRLGPDQISGVKRVTHITAEENLAAFTERHRDEPDIQETLKQFTTNPFGASAVVVAGSSAAYQQAVTIVQEPAYTTIVDTTENSLTANAQTIQRFGAISSQIRSIGYGTSALFFLIAVMVVFNTLRITIYTHRDEITIMRLVGAENGFIRAPFVIESLLYALIATIVAFIVIVPLIQGLAPFLNRLLLDYDTNLVSYFNGHLIQTFLIELLCALVLTGGSALVAVGRYVRV